MHWRHHADAPGNKIDMSFTPTRNAAEARLAAFLPKAGRAYAARRNYDLGPGRHTSVSALSPYLRRRMITETEVLAAVLDKHSMGDAEKFIQEVCWRTYWKGWLEQRPDVWAHYERDVAQLAQASEAAKLKKVLAGKTGIDCFDFWVQELIETGFLHNHARMWFASIWIFTLKLPWQLGADFFLRHLLDGDPASNTLSWRWVAGLHTQGKTYLARADNIRQYTDGRFDPTQLASHAEALVEPHAVVKCKIKTLPAIPHGTAALLLTDEDLHPESMDFGAATIDNVALLASNTERSQLVTDFSHAALTDAGNRAAAHFNCPAAPVTEDTLVAWAQAHNVTTILTAYAPVGPVQTMLADATAKLSAHGIALIQVRRAWDDMCWPHATKGFFALKERIPEFIERSGFGSSALPLFDRPMT
jgi:deoxyribodipyrimidine photo-lyase